ncbi:hypothetical protein SLS56_002832 [Neofusicoccum ribis]|uniref:Amino acid permease n=1 Tax=Neofusicoccum ribis TaxID=45134 RepID=A0ABR3T2B2_9PEZI
MLDWQGDSNFSGSMAALVLVFYTFEGWENATYVAGELRALTNDYVRDKKKLRFGAFGAVAIVTLLYMIATAGYFCVLTFDDIKKEESGDLSMAIQFSQKAFGTSFGIAICIALSAAGNLIAVVYTYSRVKQAMAVQNFMPFSKFLKQNKDYPIGGIILHWVVTVVTIVAIPNSADGYSFVLGIFPYGHTIIATGGISGTTAVP